MYIVYVRDWSLITGRGGGACEVLPPTKRGGGGGSHAEGAGGKQSFKVFFMR